MTKRLHRASKDKMLSDLLEELKPQLVRRARARAEAGERLPALLGELIQALRDGRVDPAPCRARFRVGHDLEALVAEAHLLKDLVYDLIEERRLVVPARETRLLGDWFAALTEAALREQSRRFASMLDAIPDHVLLKDAGGHLVYANRSAREAPRNGPVDPNVKEHFARALAGESVTAELRFPGPGWRENSASPVLGPDGQVEAVAVISRDIHARKMAEARLLLLSKVSALAESMEYESILSSVARLSIPDLADWTIIDVVEHGQRRRGAVAHRDPEKAALIERLLDHTPQLRDTAEWRDVLQGRSRLVTLAFDKETCDGAACETIRQLEGRSALIVPFVVLGSTIAVATFVMSADSGRRHEPEDLRLAEELARRAGQIIENARLHQQLRRSEARFRIALEHAKIAVFEEDTDFVVRWMYNPQMGVLADHLIGRRATESLEPEDAENLEALKRELLRTGQGVRLELHPMVEGVRKYIVVHYEPLRDASGAIVGLAGAGVDVTEARTAQEELTESLAFRERMMGVLGHDLRNPLGAVSGLSGLLLLQDGLPEKAREGLQRIGQSARRMTEMIETLLDFTHSRFHGSLPVERQPIDLVEVVRGVVEELRAAHPDREIRLDGSDTVRGEWDPARMAQVASNLVGNALTHGAKDAPVEISLMAGTSEASLTVKNRGEAIPQEVLDRLFEPFRRGSINGNANGNGNGHGARGLGLGLYIAREVVKAHGGSIGVESSSDCTTFSVRLAR